MPLESARRKADIRADRTDEHGGVKVYLDRDEWREWKFDKGVEVIKGERGEGAWNATRLGLWWKDVISTSGIWRAA